MDQPGPRDHRDQEELEEIKGHLDLKAIRAHKDPRAILVNPGYNLVLRCTNLC